MTIDMDADVPEPQFSPLPIAVTDALLRASERLDNAERFEASRFKRRSGETLRPGPGTPLWNVLVEEIAPLLPTYGEQARLARALGVHRQTINTWFKSRTRMPDAERTLQLVAWLIARRSGKAPALAT